MAFKDYRDLIRQMEREMQQLSDEAFRGFFDVQASGTGRFWQPAVDIHETENHLVVKMELAGSRSENLHVSLSPDDRVLSISGTRTEGHADREGRLRCHQLEIYFGPFERAIGLPSIPINRDQITATYRDGFLQILLPKRQALEKLKTRVIPITGDQTASPSAPPSLEERGPGGEALSTDNTESEDES